MKHISDELYYALKEPYSDPTSHEFDLSKLKACCSNPQPEVESNILEFIKNSNETYIELSSNIFIAFDNLQLHPNDLRVKFFSLANKFFLDTHPQLIEQLKESKLAIEAERSAFYKYTDSSGNKINAEFVAEVGGDILSMLIRLSNTWEQQSSVTSFKEIEDIEEELQGKLFSIAWLSANLIHNIKGAAFDMIAHENGIVNIEDEGLKFKIETGLKGVHFLKNAGLLRISSNITEWYIPMLNFYSKSQAKRKTVSSIRFESGIIKLNWSDSTNFYALTKAQTAVLLFHPHFEKEKLSYFEDQTLLDLVEILVLIEEVAQKISMDNLLDFKELSLNEVPIRIEENHLVDYLTSCSNKSKSIVKRVLDSLIVNEPDFYFWRAPLYRQGDFIIIPLPVMVAPNHNLIIDRWINLSNYSENLRNKMFKEYVISELFNHEKHQFHFEQLSTENIDNKSAEFDTSILIETLDWQLLIEVVTYDFPIESQEVGNTINHFGKAVERVANKWKKISPFYNTKPIIPLVLTNYPLLSGMVINQVGVVDLTLLNNYVFVGEYRRVSLAYDSKNPVTTDAITFPYYKSEQEFNENLIGFLQNPPPIYLLTQRFCWKEVPISPESIKPFTVVEFVDHIDEGEFLDIQINNLTHAINVEYFAEPDSDSRKILDASIEFSLSSIFHQLAHAPYESLDKRIDAYHTLTKTKRVGFAHLMYFINQSLGKLSEKKVSEVKVFESVKYKIEEVFQTLKEKGQNQPQEIRLSQFQFQDSFTSEQELQIISLSLDILTQLGSRKFNDNEIQDFLIQIVFMKGLMHKHDIKREFYIACSNFVSTLNFNHKYQRARDFGEEVLVTSMNNREPHYGWGILFRCFVEQKNQFESAIYGCIFLASLNGLPKLTYEHYLDSFNDSLKFFRNFRFSKLAKNVYEFLKDSPLSEYDEQKVNLTYFNSLLQGASKSPSSLDEAIDYLESKLDMIVKFGEKGVSPWLVFLYNIKRLIHSDIIEYKRDFSTALNKLENELDSKILHDLQAMLFGHGLDIKKTFIEALSNINETRSDQDYIYEIKQLGAVVEQLVRKSISPVDFDGLFLSGFVLNDQSQVFENIYFDAGTVTPFNKQKDSKFEQRLHNYSRYIIENIKVKDGQLFVWLFDHFNDVFCISIDSGKELKLHQLPKWNLESMDSWTANLSTFYFNSQKKNYYDITEQESDYQKLIEELNFTELVIDATFDELLVTTSIEVSSFPINLIIQESNFIASSKPVSNVISTEWFIQYGRDEKIKNNWTSSAWIPITDGDGTVNWGYDKIEPILSKLGTKIHTSHYPNSIIDSDINFFLAHGELDSSGFKAIYTNDEGESAIVYPKEVFGSGTIAVLFICNSGSSKDELYSNSISSFSMQLLKYGYKAVIAPFWPFDVSISPIWLEEFLSVFKCGLSLSEAVFMANHEISKYNEITSSSFYAPQGRLVMHLYGNPNISVESE